MGSIKAVIFDMDGTLVDSETLSIRAWEVTAERLGIGLPFSVIEGFIGRNNVAVTALLTEHLNGDEELARRAFDMHIDVLLDLVATDLRPMPGCREALEALRDMGLTLAVATSSARVRAIPRLERAGIDGFFTHVTCGEDVERSKPAPDIFLKAAECIGVPPQSCAMIEDSHNGVRSAHAAGGHVFMVPDKLPATPEITALCTAVLGSLHELPAAIQSVNAAE